MKERDGGVGVGAGFISAVYTNKQISKIKKISTVVKKLKYRNIKNVANVWRTTSVYMFTRNDKRF